MAQEAETLTLPETSEQDYEALLALLSATERGRAFLAEFARRSKLAETQSLRGALMRLDERLGDLLGPETPVRPPLTLVAAAAEIPKAPPRAVERAESSPPPRFVGAPPPPPAWEAPVERPPVADMTEKPPLALAQLVELLEPGMREAPAPAIPPRAPLAALTALSEEERLALFS